METDKGNYDDFTRRFDKVEQRLADLVTNNTIKHGDLHGMLAKQEVVLDSIDNMLKKHNIMLVGDDGRKGLVADVNSIAQSTASFPAISDQVKEMKTTMSHLKIAAGVIGTISGFLSSIGHKFFGGGH